MARSTRARLMAVNGALLGGLVFVTLAGGQAADPRNARPRGDYTMVSGRVQGSTTSGVYILDAVNQELIALRWDRTQRRFEGIGYRNLAEDSRLQQIGR